MMVIIFKINVLQTFMWLIVLEHKTAAWLVLIQGNKYEIIRTDAKTKLFYIYET